MDSFRLLGQWICLNQCSERKVLQDGLMNNRVTSLEQKIMLFRFRRSYLKNVIPNRMHGVCAISRIANVEILPVSSFCLSSFVVSEHVVFIHNKSL